MSSKPASRDVSDGGATLAVTATRSPEELRRAQLAVADNVNNDPRLLGDWEREADLMELLDALGLYRRI